MADDSERKWSGIDTGGCRSMAADPDEGAVRWALRCACDDVDELRATVVRLEGQIEWVRESAIDGNTILDPNLDAALGSSASVRPRESLPHQTAVTIGSLVRLVQISDWRKAGTSSVVYALNDDDLAALNACFGADWGDRGCGWESDRPAAVVIRELGKAEAGGEPDFFVCRTSNATVGTIEVDRCSDGECPVCGDE